MASSLKPTKLSDLVDDPNSLKGSWELTPHHEVQFKSKDPVREISYKGSLVAAEPDALVLSVAGKESDTEIVTRIVKLRGLWKSNAKNQIQFEVEKESGKNDTLTFKGAWEVNDRDEVVYTYETTKLKTKTKQTRELVFKGYWDIFDKNRLVYSLGVDSESAFRFRGAFQTQSISAKKGEIRYQVGVQVAGRHKVRTITLFGKWKFSQDFGLEFEIEYGRGQKKSITFTKDVFGGDGQVFLRLQKSLEESRVEAGVGFKW